MKNLKKFLKLPALCCSIGLFVVFLVVLIVNCVKPYSNSPYVYEDSMAGVTVKIEVTLNNGGKGTIETTMENASDTQYEKDEIYYKIIDGKLMYSYNENGTYGNELGEIDAFEIKAVDSVYRIAMKNHGEEAARVFYIIFMSIGVVGAAASGIYIALSKKKAKKAAK